MEVEETDLPGVVIVKPDVFADERGFLLEAYQARRYGEHPALDQNFVQDNRSRSRRGVLRGLHFQVEHPQGKLVSVTRGAVFDVAVDIDPRSPTFRRYVGVVLDDRSHHQLYVPAGYAHGFCVLSDEADLSYKCTDFYAPGDEAGIHWADASLGIDWPIADPIVSEKDRDNPTLDEYLR